MSKTSNSAAAWAWAISQLEKEVPNFDSTKPVYFTHLMGFGGGDMFVKAELFPYKVTVFTENGSTASITSAYSLKDLVKYVVSERIWICWQE